MKQLYFLIFDTAKKPSDPAGHCFGVQGYNTDLAGLVHHWGKSAKFAPENIRLFVYPSRKDWEKAQETWR